MFTIARNRRIDAARKDKRPDFDPSDPMLLPDEPKAADEQLDAWAREARIARALNTLPKEQAELVREAFYLAKSHSQIAEDTKMPLGTVKSRLRLAFARLRRAVEGEETV
jgi:RNA polymerase sigma-70 factor (ECF subfamily)